MANYDPSNARDLINRFINSIGARDETGVVPFVQAWPRIVGQDKAAHSQVLDVKNGIVLIGVDHPAWLQRMHMDSTRIVERIRREFPSLNARTLAFSIVEELTHAWKGETAGDSVENAAPRESATADDSGTGTGPRSGVDSDSGGSDRDEAGSASTDASASAVDDLAFQKRLDALKRALEEKEEADN